MTRIGRYIIVFTMIAGIFFLAVIVWRLNMWLGGWVPYAKTNEDYGFVRLLGGLAISGPLLAVWLIADNASWPVRMQEAIYRWWQARRKKQSVPLNELKRDMEKVTVVRAKRFL